MVFEKQGKANTEKTVELAVAAAKEHGIKEIVVASYAGYTPSFLEAYDLSGIHVTIVTTAYGSTGPGKNRFPDDLRKHYMEKGFSVCTAAHVLSGVERSLSGVYKGIYPGELIAAALRLISNGTKVCVEIACMACDAGCIMPGEPIVAIGGSGGGADTAVIMRPANSCKLLETRIDDFICKPYTTLTSRTQENNK